MASPVTLLVQPHYNRFFVATGEHDLTWVDEPAIGPIDDVTEINVNGTIQALFKPSLKEPVALSTHFGFDDPFRNYIGPSQVTGAGDNLSTLTVTNGSKALLYSQNGLKAHF